jgi:hypothetical protein
MNLSDLFTPDGRWRLLQEWLADNPRNKKLLEMWLRQTPEESWPQIREGIAGWIERNDEPSVAVFVRVMPLSSQIRAWIEQAKELYIDREKLDEPRPANAKNKPHRKPDARRVRKESHG